MNQGLISIEFLEANISKFVISGGNKLQGRIEVFGAKNAAMKMIAASILANGETILDNVPNISDIDNLSKILLEMGAVIRREDRRLFIDTKNLKLIEPNPNSVRAIRASVVLIGPILARFGEVHISHPGGDKIGSRPIDRHVKAFRDLGVTVTEDGGYYTFKTGPSLKNYIKFDKITWTGTENALLFASGIPQKTTIENIALEPEVFNLIEMLKKMGAQIEVHGRTATVIGSDSLRPASHTCIPDRLEAATFAIMAAAGGDGIEIINCPYEYLSELWKKFMVMGIPFEKKENSIYIKKPDKIAATDIFTAEYPGFVTDTQPPMGLLLTQAEGVSTIRENIFENRLGYLKELQKMGATIEILNQHEAKITGPIKLRGAHLESLDLRAGATLIIAGLIAEGETIIEGAETIDRGYERIEDRLIRLGANIKRVS